jgi:hypothetical protein
MAACDAAKEFNFRAGQTSNKSWISSSNRQSVQCEPIAYLKSSSDGPVVYLKDFGCGFSLHNTGHPASADVITKKERLQ